MVEHDPKYTPGQAKDKGVSEKSSIVLQEVDVSKQCTKCKAIKPLESFARDSSRWLSFYCTREVTGEN